MSNTATLVNGTERPISVGPITDSSASPLSREFTQMATTEDLSQSASKKLGRPRKLNAKSRDTVRYRSWTGYLVRDTIAEAGYELERTNPDGTRDGRDLSDLIQDLLTNWISERQQLRFQVSQNGPVTALSK